MYFKTKRIPIEMLVFTLYFNLQIKKEHNSDIQKNSNKNTQIPVENTIAAKKAQRTDIPQIPSKHPLLQGTYNTVASRCGRKLLTSNNYNDHKSVYLLRSVV